MKDEVAILVLTDYAIAAIRARAKGNTDFIKALLADETKFEDLLYEILYVVQHERDTLTRWLNHAAPKHVEEIYRNVRAEVLDEPES